MSTDCGPLTPMSPSTTPPASGRTASTPGRTASRQRRGGSAALRGLTGSCGSARRCVAPTRCGGATPAACSDPAVEIQHLTFGALVQVASATDGNGSAEFNDLATEG